MNSIALATQNFNLPKIGTLIPNRIFVGGISSNTTEDELRTFFSVFGNIKDVKVIYDKSGLSKGSYGFVTFEDQETAEALIKNESETLMLKDRKLNIGYAVRKQQIFPKNELGSTLLFTNNACSVPNGLSVLQFYPPNQQPPILAMNQPTLLYPATVMLSQPSIPQREVCNSVPVNHAAPPAMNIREAAEPVRLRFQQSATILGKPQPRPILQQQPQQPQQYSPELSGSTSSNNRIRIPQQVSQNTVDSGSSYETTNISNNYCAPMLQATKPTYLKVTGLAQLSNSGARNEMQTALVGSNIILVGVEDPNATQTVSTDIYQTQVSGVGSLPHTAPTNGSTSTTGLPLNRRVIRPQLIYPNESVATSFQLSQQHLLKNVNGNEQLLYVAPRTYYGCELMNQDKTDQIFSNPACAAAVTKSVPNNLPPIQQHCDWPVSFSTDTLLSQNVNDSFILNGSTLLIERQQTPVQQTKQHMNVHNHIRELTSEDRQPSKAPSNITGVPSQAQTFVTTTSVDNSFLWSENSTLNKLNAPGTEICHSFAENNRHTTPDEDKFISRSPFEKYSSVWKPNVVLRAQTSSNQTGGLIATKFDCRTGNPSSANLLELRYEVPMEKEANPYEGISFRPYEEGQYYVEDGMCTKKHEPYTSETLDYQTQHYAGANAVDFLLNPINVIGKTTVASDRRPMNLTAGSNEQHLLIPSFKQETRDFSGTGKQSVNEYFTVPDRTLAPNTDHVVKTNACGDSSKPRSI